MSWLTDLVRPRIQKLVKRDTPDNLWEKCPGCEQMVFVRELLDNLSVCKHCQHHFYLSPQERCKQLFDEGHFKTLALDAPPDDPLRFKDKKRYTDRLKEARARKKEAIFLATGLLHKRPLTVAAFDFKFIGGSMGMGVGEALLKGAQHALQAKTPYLTIASSGGARMQEGALSPMQMARSTVGVVRLKEAGLPFISLLTHPTTGGVAASFASIGDLNLAEPGALIGFTGARVIQETLRTTLPKGFQTAEFQLEHGALDAVVHRHDLKQTLFKVISHLKKAA